MNASGNGHECAAGSDCIGPFRILREIGRGQNATVYEAHDTRRDEVVALKVHEVRRVLVGSALEGEEGDLAAMRAEATLLRFVREADAIRRLSHPNIVRIRDAGAEQGKFYIAMERLHGETLRARLIERGPLPIREAVSIALQVASALRFAHDQGITHRDVKPDNIFLLPDGTAKLMDFGAARVLGENSLTQTGTVIGSPAYMAPEQVSGQSTDGRTDIWGLGATLFEAVTGHKPFPGESVATVMYAILHKRPDFGQVPSPPLARALERALAKRPGARYAAVNAFADALRTLPAPGGEADAAAPGQRRLAARPLLVAVVVALAVVALLCAGFFLMRSRATEYHPGQILPPPTRWPLIAAVQPAKPRPAPQPPASPRPAPPRRTPAPVAAAPARPRVVLLERSPEPETKSVVKAKPVPAPRPPARSGGAPRRSMPPRRFQEPAPFPDNPEVVLPEALANGEFAETVEMSALIDEVGNVEKVEVLRSSGDERVDRTAAETVRQWRYRPARRAGQPVAAIEQLEVTVGDAFENAAAHD